MGTDTGASIRSAPAALCGVVGLKPAAGHLWTEHVPLSETLDHMGVDADVHSASVAWGRARPRGTGGGIQLPGVQVGAGGGLLAAWDPTIAPVIADAVERLRLTSASRWPRR